MGQMAAWVAYYFVTGVGFLAFFVAWMNTTYGIPVVFPDLERRFVTNPGITDYQFASSTTLLGIGFFWFVLPVLVLVVTWLANGSER